MERRGPSDTIEGPFPFLYLDATFLDARWARTVENVSALVAYGVDLTGHRRLLAVTLGAEESEQSWAELLTQLCERGLSGVQLVIADDHRGLAAAVRRHLLQAARQRCTVHLERNVLTKTPQRLRVRVAKQLRAVFDASELAEARKRLHEFGQGLGRQVPEALACLEAGFNAATQSFAFPRDHWTRIRSTNGLERLHGEVKRRTRSIGAFPDRDSALRLVTAVALETAHVWAGRVKGSAFQAASHCAGTPQPSPCYQRDSSSKGPASSAVSDSCGRFAWRRNVNGRTARSGLLLRPLFRRRRELLTELGRAAYLYGAASAADAGVPWPPRKTHRPSTLRKISVRLYSVTAGPSAVRALQ